MTPEGYCREVLHPGLMQVRVCVGRGGGGEGGEGVLGEPQRCRGQGGGGCRDSVEGAARGAHAGV
jgi:hypothetical protein